jgi:hypothetical protein
MQKETGRAQQLRYKSHTARGKRGGRAESSGRNLPLRQSWPEPYIYGIYTVFLAGKPSNIRSYTAYIYIRFWPTLLLGCSIA